MVSRRRVLQTSGAALLGGLAGCSALPGSESATEIGELQVQNYVPESTTVQVLVRDRGDPVYWSAKPVPAAGEDGEAFGRTYFEGFPAEPGQYTLHVKTAAQSTDEWATTDLTSEDAACSTFQVEIGSRESASGLDELSMLVSHNDTYCEQKAEN
jgi:hypothetical protein